VRGGSIDALEDDSLTTVENVYVRSGMDVVEQVPAGMIRVAVDGEVISAVPAPVRK
jgi:hypothetical protein